MPSQVVVDQLTGGPLLYPP